VSLKDRVGAARTCRGAAAALLLCCAGRGPSDTQPLVRPAPEATGVTARDLPAAAHEPPGLHAHPPGVAATPKVPAPSDETSGTVSASGKPSPSGTTELPLPGFLPSLVSWPRARRWPQPLLIVAHGAGDHAEPHCEIWRRVLGERGVISCLRGRALRKHSPEQGYYFPDHLTLEREVVAALAALRRVHPEWVDVERGVYAGYSQGAQMGLLMSIDQGARLPRLLLIEGGSGDFSEANVRRFARSGGERVALVCGTPGCQRNALIGAARLEQAGIRSDVYYAPDAGHTYLGTVSEQAAQAFLRLTESDERWEP
jgi:predicted esterase